MIYRSSVLSPFFRLVIIAGLILPSLATPPFALASEPDWSQPIAINDYGGVGVKRNDPHMVVSGSGKLYLVWVDERNSCSDIYFSYSADQGSSWSANVQVNDDNLGGLEPQVAIDAAGKIYVAWARGAGVYLATSTNNGSSWSAATQVTSDNNPNNLRLQADTRPGMEGKLNAMWLVWISTSYTKVTARHKASYDGGQSWINSRLVLEGLYDGEVVDIRGMDFARAGYSLRAALHNVPVDSNILSASSANNGESWGVGLLPHPVGVAESEPSISIDPYNMSFYGYHSGTGKLTGLNSRPGTEGWQAATINDNPSLSEIQGPAALAAYKDGRYYAAWTDQMDGSTIHSLFISESNDFGRSWSADIRVSEVDHHGKDASLGVDNSGNLYLVWHDQLDYVGFFDIMFSRRGPSTGTPTPPEPLIVNIPPEGGTFVSNDPLELVEGEFPSVFEELIVKYVYKPSLPVSSNSLESGALQSAGVWFDLTATTLLGDPVTDLETPMTLTVRYLNAGSVPTETLKLYWWNGSEYVTDGVTQLDRTDYSVTSTVDHLSLFNLMSEGPDLNQRAYLPLLISSPGE